MKRVLALAAITVSLTGCATVGAGNRGIKVSLGKTDGHLMQPGFYGYNPMTDQINHRSIRQQTLEGESTPLTADQQKIVIKYNVQFRVPESQLLNIFQNYQGDPYESLVSPQIQESFRQVISGYKADAVTKDLNKIKDQVLAQTQGNLKNKDGQQIVEVIDIPITHIELPQVLQDAIAAKQVMEQQSLQKKYELDKANKEADITIANAQAQAKSIQLQSDALQKSPSLIEYERVKKWDGHLPQTVLGGAGTLFNLK